MAIALSLLTAAVAKPPFNQLICTFSATPKLHLVKGDTLVKQVSSLRLSNRLACYNSMCFGPLHAHSATSFVGLEMP